MPLEPRARRRKPRVPIRGTEDSITQ